MTSHDEHVTATERSRPSARWRQSARGRSRPQFNAASDASCRARRFAQVLPPSTWLELGRELARGPVAPSARRSRHRRSVADRLAPPRPPQSGRVPLRRHRPRQGDDRGSTSAGRARCAAACRSRGWRCMARRPRAARSASLDCRGTQPVQRGSCPSSSAPTCQSPAGPGSQRPVGWFSSNSARARGSSAWAAGAISCSSGVCSPRALP